MNEDTPLEIPLESVPDHHPNPAQRSAHTHPEEETYRVKMSDGQLYGPITLDEIVQWAREGRIPRDGLLISKEGGEIKSVFAEPRLASILSSPPTSPAIPVPSLATPTSKSFLFPTGNQYALIGYYLSVAGFLFPLLCPVSLGLGVLGVFRAIKYPKAKGLAHAIVAIILSFGSPIFWYMVVTWIDSI